MTLSTKFAAVRSSANAGKPSSCFPPCIPKTPARHGLNPKAWAHKSALHSLRTLLAQPAGALHDTARYIRRDGTRSEANMLPSHHPSERQRALERAFNYPYRRPRCSFIMVAGKFLELEATPELADYRKQKLNWKDLKVREFVLPDKAQSNGLIEQRDVYMDCVGEGSWMDLASVAAQLDMPLMDVFHERIPVLAIGSNAGLEQLSRKFGKDAVIPVLMIRLEDFDVVYCPTISAYGSVPATIQRAPGVQCDIAITLLSEEQVDNMHKTEAGYDYVMFDHVPVRLKLTLSSDMEVPLLSPIASPVFVYVESQGVLTSEQCHIPLQEIPGMNRKQAGLTQKDVQRVIYSFCHQDPDYLKILIDMGISASCFTSPLVDLDWRQIVEEEVEKFVLNNINIGPEGRRRVRAILMKHHGQSFMDVKRDPAETNGQVYELLQRLHHPPDQDD